MASTAFTKKYITVSFVGTGRVSIKFTIKQFYEHLTLHAYAICMIFSNRLYRKINIGAELLAEIFNEINLRLIQILRHIG